MPILCLQLTSIAFYESLSEEYWGLGREIFLSQYLAICASMPK